MGGDLGNLLTGEMGEAEARFEREDFAAVCGRRVAQRVRRRRAVRAAGVGGGTMLTAGALAVGATNVPWGAWGTAAGVAPGASSTECVTPSAVLMGTAGSMGTVVRGTLSPSADPSSSGATSVLWSEYYLDTGDGIVTFAQDADGNWWTTQGDGEREPLTPSEDGLLTVVTADGEAVVTMNIIDPEGSGAPGDEFTYRVDVESVDGADDCYTPSPTPSATASATASPSPERTPAIKPEDVIGDSPFECGFEFPSESYGSEDLWIDGVTWADGAEVEAEIRLGFEDPADASIVNPTASVPGVSAHYASADRAAEPDDGLHFLWTTDDPTFATDIADLPDATGFESEAIMGHAFVGAVDGRVVATYEVPEGGPYPFWVSGNQSDGSALVQLLDGGLGLTSCDAAPVDQERLSLVAVMGLKAQHADGTVDPTVYAWLPVGKP